MPAAPGPELDARRHLTGVVAGWVDEPSDGATVARGPLRVSGWHAFDLRPALAIAIAIDGDNVAVTTPGTVLRPDVAAAYNEPTLEATGWSATIDLTDWPRASARLDVMVWPNRETAPMALAPVIVWLGDGAVSAPSGALDAPSVEVALGRGVVSFAGWAFDPAAPIDRVEVVVGDRPPEQARLGLVRDDLLKLWDVPHARLAGFEATFDLSDLPGYLDRVGIQVTGLTLSGVRFLIDDRTHALTPPVADVGSSGSGERRQAELRERTRHMLGRLGQQEGAAAGELDLLVFAHDLGFGGAQLWLSEFLDRSGAGRDYPCTVIAPQPGPLLDGLEGLGIAVHVTNGYAVGDIETYEGSVAELSSIGCCKSHTAVLVDSFCSFIGVDVAGRLGLPCAWAIHESYPPALLWPALYPPGHVDAVVRATAVRALGQASALLFVAESTRQLFVSATDPERAVVIPYGVDTASIDRARGGAAGAGHARSRARASLGLPPGATILLVVGALEPRKAQTTTAEAFALVAREFPEAVLIFLGATAGPYTGALESYVTDADLQERCRVVAAVEDTSVWYLAADVLVSASDVESLPRTVLEAMCFHVPVLATSVFGLPDVITDGTTGWLFEPRSVAGMAAAFRRVLSLGAKARRAVAEAASAAAHDRLSSEGYVAAVSHLLHGLAADPTAPIGGLLADREGFMTRPSD